MARLYLHTEEEEREIMKHLECSEDGLKEDTESIMDWFKKQPHLVEAGIDPDVVRTFLLVNAGSREKAKRRIDNHYKYRGMAPEIIQSRIETLSSNQDIFNCYRYVAIPKLYEGSRVTVVQFDADPSSFSAEELFRNLYMMNDIRIKYDFFRGDIWVVDLKNVSIGHFRRLSPILTQKSAQMFQDGLGFKVHAIHVLNAPSIGQKIVNFFRLFVKAKIMDRVIIHFNLEELHAVFPKQYLPKDYGGDDRSMQEYKDIYEEELRKETTRQFLLNACKHVSSEEKRPPNNYNDECLSGSFKKLDLD